jgi:hypothetical protein
VGKGPKLWRLFAAAMPSRRLQMFQNNTTGKMHCPKLTSGLEATAAKYIAFGNNDETADDVHHTTHISIDHQLGS